MYIGKGVNDHLKAQTYAPSIATRCICTSSDSLICKPLLIAAIRKMARIKNKKYLVGSGVRQAMKQHLPTLVSRRHAGIAVEKC